MRRNRFIASALLAAAQHPRTDAHGLLALAAEGVRLDDIAQMPAIRQMTNEQ